MDTSSTSTNVAAGAAFSGTLAVAANVTAWGQQGLRTVGPVVNKGRFFIATGQRVKNDLPGYVREHGVVRGVGELKPGLLLRDLAIGATKDTVPTSGGTIKLFGKVLTTNGWGASLRVGAGLSAAVLGATVIASTVNLWSGVEQQGASGLVGTTQGRTGTILGATALAGLGLSTFAAVARRNPAVVKDGVELLARQSRKDAFVAADWLQTWQVKLPVAVGAPLATANMLGAFNFLDREPAK